MTESYIHIAMRSCLKHSGWLLVAGQFPGGTDDELGVLAIRDPAVAKDSSPDPRRHSTGEFVPDLFAYRQGVILVVEAKPQYSIADRNKLTDLLTTKMARMIQALKKFSLGKTQFSGIDYDTVTYIPVLAFGNPDFAVRHRDTNFAHIYVRDLRSVEIVYFADNGGMTCTTMSS